MQKALVVWKKCILMTLATADLAMVTTRSSANLVIVYIGTDKFPLQF